MAILFGENPKNFQEISSDYQGNKPKVQVSSKFKTDLKKFRHNRPTLKILDEVLQLLINGKSLPEKFRDHSLLGKWNPARECHIKPDVLLIYRINKSTDEIELVRLGSHSDLFM